MLKIKNPRQYGQILIIVAVMLLGLMAMLGLVLDGGNLFFYRRQAQLAADAGALAGARAYCLTEEESAAVSSAWDYAVERNNVDNANTTVLAGTFEVTVDTSITFDTFFLGLLGRDQMTTSATATAVCSPPTFGLGVMPIAWSCREPVGESDSEDCDLLLRDHYEDADGDGEYGDGDGLCTFVDPEDPDSVGDPVYIIVDSEEITYYCESESGSSGGSEEDVAYVDCDLNDDGIDDFQPLSGGMRSWLDLDGGGGGAADLRDWIENGVDETITIHTWLGGQPGVETSVYKTVYDYQLYNEVVIPVYDQVWLQPPCSSKLPSGSDFNCSDQWHTGIDSVIPSSSEKHGYYHIISFTLFVTECVAGKGGTSDSCPAAEYLKSVLDLGPQLKSIEGCFVEGFNEGLGGGGETIDTGSYIIHLKE